MYQDYKCRGLHYTPAGENKWYLHCSLDKQSGTISEIDRLKVVEHSSPSQNSFWKMRGVSFLTPPFPLTIFKAWEYLTIWVWPAPLWKLWTHTLTAVVVFCMFQTFCVCSSVWGLSFERTSARLHHRVMVTALCSRHWIYWLLLVGFHSCYSTWGSECTGAARGGGGWRGREQIAVMDDRSKIAHVMMFRNKKAAKFKEQLLPFVWGRDNMYVCLPVLFRPVSLLCSCWTKM